MGLRGRVLVCGVCEQRGGRLPAVSEKSGVEVGVMTVIDAEAAIEDADQEMLQVREGLVVATPNPGTSARTT